MSFEITLKNIHKDSRGEVTCFYKDGIEYTLLSTKKGYARGGCVHPRHEENFVVLKGVVRYYFKYPYCMNKADYYEGASDYIEIGIPHYYVALEDSITLEWGADLDEKNTKDPYLRSIVDTINANMVLKETHSDMMVGQ